ncbi:MAG: hypothetical protein WBP72_03350 [Rhodocyclaceae bacterium]
MPQHRLLHADATGISAYSWRSGRLRGEGVFRSSETGATDFQHYLRKHPNSVFYLLADMAEEGFQFDTIPFVRGSDRQAVVRRKLGQLFYGTPLVAGLPLDREPGGRRDQRMLFAALTRLPLIEPWLTAARQCETQLAGVYSVPLLAPAMARKLKVAAPHCLLVSVGRAGIRQTFLENRRLRFSRLSPLAAGSAVETARACAAETSRLYKYLAGQRLVPSSAPLPVLILTDAHHHQALTTTCIDSEELAFHFSDFETTRQRCGLRDHPEMPAADALFLHLLALEAPSEQFAPENLRHFYRLWQARFALKSFGAMTLLGCLLFAAHDFYDAYESREAIKEQHVMADADQAHYTAILKAFPPMPTSLDNLRAVTTRFAALESRSAPPRALLARISQAVDASPAVEIERIDWVLSASPDAPSRTATPAGAALFAVATITGTLPTANRENQRAMIGAVNDFAAELRRDGNLGATVLRQPLDLESANTLRRSGEETTSPDVPRFNIRVTQALEPAP